MLVRKKLLSIIFNFISYFIFGSLAIAWTANSVQGQEIRTLKDYLDNCIPEDEDEELPEVCDRLKEKARESSSQEEDDESSGKKSNQEEEKSVGIGGYAGVVLGVYFPDLDEDRGVFPGNDVETDTGFGSSAFAGISFNRYLGLDLEVNALAGDIDSDLDEDEIYTMAGLFLNPRFTLPLTDQKNSLALYLSPGLGVSQLSTSLEDEIDVVEGNDTEEFDRTTIIEDESRFTWQIKGGVSVPISSKFSIIPQLRYTSQTGDDAVDYFGVEVGVKFDF